jgi:hypothetical protein
MPLLLDVKLGATSLVTLKLLEQALFRVLFNDYKDRAKEFK